MQAGAGGPGVDLIAASSAGAVALPVWIVAPVPARK